MVNLNPLQGGRASILINDLDQSPKTQLFCFSVHADRSALTNQEKCMVIFELIFLSFWKSLSKLVSACLCQKRGMFKLKPSTGSAAVMTSRTGQARSRDVD